MKKITICSDNITHANDVNFDFLESSCVGLPSWCRCDNSFIHKQLAPQLEERYPDKNTVKLMTYNNEQYNMEDFSYMPAMLTLGRTYKGIVWFRWPKLADGSYFDCLRSKGLPEYAELCSDEQNEILSAVFPQPKLSAAMYSGKNIRVYDTFVTNSCFPSATFLRELSRQFTPMIDEVTENPEAHKRYKLGDWPSLNHFEDRDDGYTYAILCVQYSNLLTVSALSLSPIFFYVRWRSNTDKKFIHYDSIVGENDFTLELCKNLPNNCKLVNEYKCPTVGFLKKQDFIDFINEANRRARELDAKYSDD